MLKGPSFRELLEINREQHVGDADLQLRSPPLPLLITGITGVAGYNALAYFQSCFPGEVFGLLPPKTPDFTAPDTIPCNPDDPLELDKVLEKRRFESILDCAGNCDLKGCQLDPQIAWTLNVEIVHNLARLTRKHSIRLVHYSVDLVFGGKPGGNYIETDPTDPVTVYGQTMVEGEKLILAEDPYAATLRISLPMGVSFNGHAGAVDWIASRFRKPAPATLLLDEVRTPTYTDCLSRVSHYMLASDYEGLFHSGTPRPLSLYQIAQAVNRTGGFHPDLLYGIRRDEMGPIPPRAGDVSMNSSKLMSLPGVPPIVSWPASDRFVPHGKLWHYERPAGENGSIPLMYEQLTRRDRPR